MIWLLFKILITIITENYISLIIGTIRSILLITILIFTFTNINFFQFYLMGYKNDYISIKTISTLFYPVSILCVII